MATLQFNQNKKPSIAQTLGQGANAFKQASSQLAPFNPFGAMKPAPDGSGYFQQEPPQPQFTGPAYLPKQAVQDLIGQFQQGQPQQPYEPAPQPGSIASLPGFVGGSPVQGLPDGVIGTYFDAGFQPAGDPNDLAISDLFGGSQPEGSTLMGIGFDDESSGIVEENGTTWIEVPGHGRLDYSHVEAFASGIGSDVNSVISGLRSGDPSMLQQFYQWGQQYLWDSQFGMDAALHLGVSVSQSPDGTTFVDLPGIGQIDSKHASQWAQELGHQTIGDAFAAFGDVGAAYSSFQEWATRFFNPPELGGAGGNGFVSQWLPNADAVVHEHLEAAAAAAGIPVEMMTAVMMLESGGQWATSHAGATGYMQVVPSIWDGLNGYSVYDPVGNLYLGAAVLAYYLNANGGNVYEALRGYHGYGSDGYTTDQEYADIVAANMRQMGYAI